MTSFCRRLSPRGNKVLRVHIQGVSDAVDVIEIPDHLSCIVDGDVVETDGAEFFRVLLCHRLRGLREFLGKCAQRLIRSGEARRSPVASQRMSALVDRGLVGALAFVFDFGTEVVSMGGGSVAAIVVG